MEFRKSMVSDPLLRKAVNLTRRKKYDESVKMLEVEVFRYQDSFSYYQILGITCLYAGDFGGAHTYLSKAKNIKFRSPQTLLGLAVLFLRRGETDRALDLYLDIQDMEPDNRIARKALKIIRKYSGGENLSAWIEQGKLATLYPPLPKAGISISPVPFIAAGIILSILIGVFLGIKRIPVFQRGGLEASILEREERENPVETGGTYRYILTREQVLAGYNHARKLFNQYHDERAKLELNRILESNASPTIKNKALLLKGYMEIPGFDTLKDHFTYTEVSRDPFLYRDCFVLWRGSAANIKTGPEKTSFDLLVGYDTRTIMEGVVTVELVFPADINPIEPLEVLGYVVPAAVDKFIISGTGIHQSPSN
jgi:tetratricopeptide (TPR) repeat protein